VGISWRSHGWYLVGMLTLLYALSFLDRMILLLLVPGLSAELHLSDIQIGLLFGLGFGAVYTLIGLPLAHWLDRGPRVLIITLGVSLWSLTTLASAFAPNYWMLLACRSGVAIGEAVLTPAAISLIGDVFSPTRRALPTAIYASTSAIMTTGSFVVGAVAVSLANLLAPSVMLQPWRLTLIIVGVPGLLLAPLLFFTVKEPARTVEASDQRALNYASVRQALSYLFKARRLWGSLFLAMSFTAICSAALTGWTATLLVRAQGMTTAQAGFAFGTAGLVGGVLGVVFWPAVATLWLRSGRRDALIVALGAGLTLHIAAALAVGQADNRVALLALVTLSLFGMGSMATLPNLIIQAAGPPQMRARLVAGNLLAIGLIGLALGTALTAWIAERLFSGPHALGAAITLLAAILLPLVALCIWYSRPAYLSACADARGEAPKGALLARTG
jgi:MFS family permease